MSDFTFGKAGMDLPRLFTDNFYASKVVVVSRTSAGFVMEFNDPWHTRVEAEGLNLSYGADGLPAEGSITSWSATSDTGLLGTATGLKISAASLMEAAKSEGRDDKAFY